MTDTIVSEAKPIDLDITYHCCQRRYLFVWSPKLPPVSTAGMATLAAEVTDAMHDEDCQG